MTVTVGAVNDAPGGSVTIDGTVSQGEELTANTSAVTDADGLGTFSYQWKRTVAGTETAISDATSSTYTLVQADVGATITVTVSWTDLGGTSESLTSTATAAVTNANDAPGGSVTIDGTVSQGEELTANHKCHHGRGRSGDVLLPVEADRGRDRDGDQRCDVVDLHAGAGGCGRDDHGDGVLDRPRRDLGEPDLDGDGGGGERQRRAWRLCDDRRHGIAGRGADGEHERHHGRGRSGDVLLPVEADRRRDRDGDQRGDILDLHAGAGGRWRDDHGDGLSWTDLGGTAESLTSTATAAVANANGRAWRLCDDRRHGVAGRRS